MGFEKSGRTPSVMYTVNNAKGKYFIEAYHSDGSNYAFGFATITDTVAQMKKGSDDPHTPIFFHFTEKATIIQQQRFRDTCREAGFLNVRLISFDTVNLSLLIGSHHINVIPGRFVAVLTSELFYIVTRDGRNLKLHKAAPFEQFRFRRCSVDSVVISNMTNDFEEAAVDKIRKCLHPIPVNVGTFWPMNDFLPVLLRSHLGETTSNRYIFNAFCDFDIDIKGQKLIETRFKELPLSVTTDVAVSNVTKLDVNLIKSERTVEVLKTFTLKSGARFVRIVILVESCCDITATMEVVDTAETLQPVICAGGIVATDCLSKEASPAKVEPTVMVMEKSTQDVSSKPTDNNVVKSKKNRSQRRREGRRNAQMNGAPGNQSKPAAAPIENGSIALPRELSQLKLDPLPTTVLTFTSDNRVLIKADTTYTGNKDVFAYVRLQDGIAPMVGQQAFDALQTHPNSVFYDVTRLLAVDFDPAHPDPSWRFKTSSDTDGKVLIHGSDGITTFPIVLFGLVVKSTLLYIKEHVQSEINELGIRLPSSSAISATDLKGVSDKIGMKLVII
uniref:DET1 homolog n=1 Tax=Panagrellus redivivus TaxID=6233 RepID=A0A7E5A0Q4_PANRE